jgi:hypothetical protein
MGGNPQINPCKSCRSVCEFTSKYGRDEHFSRSPDCPFFTLVNNHIQSPAAKRTKSKKDRTSKASRLSTQSSFTVASDAPSIGDLAAEEGDSILTTATNATSKKMGKGKKAPAGKGRKTKAKKEETIEVPPNPEPVDDDFEVKVDQAPKPTQGRKRKTEDVVESTIAPQAVEPLPKRRATRTRASVASNDTMLDESTIVDRPAQPTKKKPGRPSNRKASAASVASLRESIPNDDEIDAALEADLNRQLTDDDDRPDVAQKTTRSSKITNIDHAMFGAEPVEIDEAAIEAELKAMEVESKPLPKAKGAKGKQPRKVSTKQQATAKKAAEAAEAAAQKAADEDASQQIAMELEESITMQQSSPIAPPKKQRVSRQASQQGAGKATRGSVVSVNESNVSIADDTTADHGDESGNETDASMASQSTVVRGNKARRGSTLKKGKVGEKAGTRNIEEIVKKQQVTVVEEFVERASPMKDVAVKHLAVDVSIAEETFYTPAPEERPPVSFASKLSNIYSEKIE